MTLASMWQLVANMVGCALIWWFIVKVMKPDIEEYIFAYRRWKSKRKEGELEEIETHGERLH